MFVNKPLIYLGCASLCCYNAKPLTYYFYVKTKTSVDFQNCINVPLTGWMNLVIACLVEYFKVTKEDDQIKAYIL